MPEQLAAPPVLQPLFRIEVEWDTGGFGRTLPFADKAAATAWAEAQVARRAGVTITVTPRLAEPPAHDEASAIEADLAYNRMKNSGELFRQEVRRAERLERFNPQQDAWR
jgi:hypothetical protein